jgi:hypothetical protein
VGRIRSGRCFVIVGLGAVTSLTKYVAVAVCWFPATSLAVTVTL